jgi:DNA polymerase phi
MNWFWDLASDDLSRRLYAGTMIIKHVQTTTATATASASNNELTLSSDGEYALKRLIRGVSSSRDSARQGFSSCLCQFYQTFPFIESSKIISLIEESTKVSPPPLSFLSCLISLSQLVQ